MLKTFTLSSPPTSLMRPAPWPVFDGGRNRRMVEDRAERNLEAWPLALRSERGQQRKAHRAAAIIPAWLQV
jgi:hypothetical protein